MLALVTVLLFSGLFLMGKAVLLFLYGNKTQSDFAWEDIFLTGGMALIGLAEGAHLGALVRGQSVSAAMKYFFILFVGMTVLSVLFLALRSVIRKKRNGESKKTKFCLPASKEERILLFAVLGMLLCQLILVIGKKAVYLDYDITLETVMTFLSENTLHGSRPLTGMPYELGMPSRLKILCLPTFYAVLCQATGISPEFLVWHLVSAVVLLFAYLSYRSLGRALFLGNAKNEYLFMLIVGLLFFVGDVMYGLEGFGLLHCGFQGTTIRNAVILPYLFGLCLRRKWKLAVLALLAEICLVWTLYGIGMGLLTAALYILIPFLKRLFFNNGKEAAK